MRGSETVRRARPRALRALAAAALALMLAGTAAASAQAEPQEEPTFSCTSVTFTYTGFPDLPNNTVSEQVRVDGVILPKRSFSFDGPSAADVFPISLAPGHHSLDAWARWKTNGVGGGRDQPLKGGITCATEPRFSIEKLQEVVDEKGTIGFTSQPLAAALGQTVRYEILVKNTGNVPLTFTELNDERCDPGTLSGGPGEASVAPGEISAYFCQHVVGLADLGESTYRNTVTTSAAQTGEEATTVSSSSNTVLVNLLSSSPKKEEDGEEPKGNEEKSPGTPQGNSAGSASNVAQGGVQGVKFTSPVLPPPVFGQSANLLRVSGTVLVKTPGSNTFIPLAASTSVPLGTIIDATRGIAEIVSAADPASHTTETGLFYAGVFRLGQAIVHRHGEALATTILTLVGRLPSCASVRHRGHKSSAGALASRKRSSSRKLWGDAKGNFRTVGRYAAATVRGTKWLTEDLCAGTLIRVARHAVDVEDFPHHRRFLLGAPHQFLVHPGRGG